MALQIRHWERGGNIAIRDHRGDIFTATVP